MVHMQNKVGDLKVRPVMLKDADAICRIINSLVAEGRYTTYSKTSVAEQRAVIESMAQNEIMFVAEFDEEVIGFQFFGQFPDEAEANRHVGTMGTFLLKSQRGMGLGGELARRTFRWARNKGFEKVVVWVFADNEPGLRFYEKLGFKPIGKWKKQVKIGNKYHDEIVLEKFL